MIQDLDSIRVIDVLYRVSTPGQEDEGESLANQRREVEEKWAKPLGIKVRNRIELAESGKSALKLVGGGGLRFNRRAELAALIAGYEKNKLSRPDAVVVAWADRLTRDKLDYEVIIRTLRQLGIRLLAICDGLELTDPANDLLAGMKTGFAQEFLRLTSLKIKENRSSRRDRGLWQGGKCPDGYRTHEPACSGRVSVEREKADGSTKTFKQRACACSVTTMLRDPQREPVLTFIWQQLDRSPLSFQGMADEVNARGYRRPDGQEFQGTDLYRIGENPHYAGILATDRWDRDDYDSSIERRKPLREQGLKPGENSIPQPYVSEKLFWEIQGRRYNTQSRYVTRSANGSVSELTGLLFCPVCAGPMFFPYSLSSTTNGNGSPRKAPRKKYVYAKCASSKQKNGATCSATGRTRVSVISRELIDHLTAVAKMSDVALAAALKLRTAQTPAQALEREGMAVQKKLSEMDGKRRFLMSERAAGRISQTEYEADLFAFRTDEQELKLREREIAAALSTAHLKPNFEATRSAIQTLRDHWDVATVEEKAEAFRLLVARVTYDAGRIVVEEYGPGFVDAPRIKQTEVKTTRRA